MQLAGVGGRIRGVVRRVVERPVGVREQPRHARAQLRVGVGGDPQACDQPGVVDGRQERVDRVAAARPRREGLAGVGVVPVEPEAVGALQPLDGGDGAGEAAVHRRGVDDPEPAGRDCRPQPAADVGRRGVDGRRERARGDVHGVRGQSEVRGQGLDGAIRVAEPAAQQGVGVGAGGRAGGAESEGGGGARSGGEEGASFHPVSPVRGAWSDTGQVERAQARQWDVE